MDRSIGRRGVLVSSSLRRLFLAAGLGVASVIGADQAQAQQMCGGATYPFPYTDVSGVSGSFCPGIMEAYVTGISKGTTPTTFSPNNDVTRVQMTTFLQRTVDQVLTRGSRRAALNQWWTPQNSNSTQVVGIGGEPSFCAADGENIWATTQGQVIQVQASTGTILGTWGALDSVGVVAAAGKVFVAGHSSPGKLYVIDPTQPPASLSSVATLGVYPDGIAFDGTHVWTANLGSPGSVSIIEATSPYTVSTVTTGFSTPDGILYDGAHIWVTDNGAGTLLQLNAGGAIVKSVNVGSGPLYPVFDGTNIWVPNFGDNSIAVVQASTGNVVATITANATNKLNGPTTSSFDGERVLVTNYYGSVTIFKAADFSFIANVASGPSSSPVGACSDGINFWVPLFGTGNLLRF